MPQFGLRGIYAAKYINNGGVVSHENIQHVGDAMTVNIELRSAEGRLYAEDMLAEYMRKATGGTISIGVKYIKQAAQMLLFNSRTKSREITYTPAGATAPTTATVEGLVIGGQDEGQYVSIAFYRRREEIHLHPAEQGAVRPAQHDPADHGREHRVLHADDVRGISRGRHAGAEPLRHRHRRQ